MSVATTITHGLRDIFSSEKAETDDYANRRVPRSYSWGYWGIMLPITGGGTAGFWLAFGPSLAQPNGVPSTLVGLGYAIVAQTIIGYVLIKVAAESRLGSDLASRGLGFGFLGSLLTVVVYGTNWFFYWALESQILGAALASYADIPLWAGRVIVGIGVFIPLTIYGMVFVTRFQNWTMPIFGAWLAYNLFVIFDKPNAGQRASDFFSYGGPVHALGVLGAIAAINGLVAVVPLLSMEFARFARPDSSPRRRFWGLLGVSAIPQNVFTWGIYVTAGIVIWRATGSVNPGLSFIALSGWVGFVGLFITQIRINLQNTYLESVCLATFFARLPHFTPLRAFTPGRAFWTVVTCVVGTALIFANMLSIITPVLTFEGVVLFAWIGTLVGDYAIVRRLLHLPIGHIEHRRAYLPRINPVGTCSFITGAAVGLVLTYLPHFHSGVWTGVQDLASFIGFGVALVTHPLYARAFLRPGQVGVERTPYMVRQPEPVPASVTGADGLVHCVQCGIPSEPEDVARCPVRQFGWICAQCCAGDATCGTVCQSTTVDFPPLEGGKRLEATPGD